jgi:hypothetical protein
MTDLPGAGDALLNDVVLALMKAMGCEMNPDVGDFCCSDHDWHEDDNTAEHCGYAVKLAAAVLPPIRAHIASEVAALDWQVLDSSTSETATVVNSWVRSAYEVAESVVRGGAA